MVLLIPTPAQSQSLRIDRDEVVEMLNNDDAESPTSTGLVSNGVVIEPLTALDGVTRTLVLTTPNGSGRLVAACEGWVDVAFESRESRCRRHNDSEHHRYPG